MFNSAGAVQPTGPQSRFETELIQMESHRRELWVLIIFLIGVLVLGGLSFLFPNSFWHLNVLEIKISPQIFFLMMMVVVLIVLSMLKREATLQLLRLQNLRQTVTAQMETSASMLDPLTNVFNRKVLRELLQNEISRAERNKRPLGLIMCDLNEFKQLNDRFGHLLGDYVLSQFAVALRSCVRGSDYIVRYGGDEFLIILPETDKKGAEIVQGRIHKKIEGWNAQHREDGASFSVSMGVYHHVAGQSLEQDVVEVDARMYAQKQLRYSGRASVPTTK